LAAPTDALVRIKSHYPEVDMAKIKGGADTIKDLQALELEVMKRPPRWRRTSTSRAMVEPAAKVATVEMVATAATSSS
jgi:hypothetical protein